MRVLTGASQAAGAAGSRRVLRGGSFINNRENARAAVRNRNNPHNRNRNNGVRVGVAAAAHFSPERSGSPELSPGYGLS
jgi:formylglycine-generating enzyme required for sulfatase activity